MTKDLPRLRIVYYDDERSDDVVIVGQYEVILAERKFGRGAVADGDADAITFAAYEGARRAGVVGEGVAYDAWARSVAMVEALEPGESPTPLET